MAHMSLPASGSKAKRTAAPFRRGGATDADLAAIRVPDSAKAALLFRDDRCLFTQFTDLEPTIAKHSANTAGGRIRPVRSFM
jgi:hypothetical protein